MNGRNICVVVVNWEGGRHVERCLDALERQTIRDEIDVIVIDNASTDGSLERIRTREPRISVIANAENAGYSRACNQAFAATKAEFIAILNNDAFPEPRWIEQLVTVMKSADDIGLCASKIVSAADPQVIDNTGHVVCADGLTRGRGRLERDTGQYDAVEEVFCASGAAALLRRAMLDDAGPFDDHFFAYCEDADLGFRARLRGWRCVYVPTAVVRHLFSASTDPYSAFKALQVERNRLWLAIKDLPLPLLAASFFVTAARYFWQAYGAFFGKGASGLFVRQASRMELVSILIKAHAAAWRELPRVLRQRRAIQSRRKVSSAELRSTIRRFGISARRMALME